MTLFDGEPENANTAGCPTLAAFLFLRLGWDTSTLNQSRSLGAFDDSL
jgi:hypothetical protein